MPESNRIRRVRAAPPKTDRVEVRISFALDAATGDKQQACDWVRRALTEYKVWRGSHFDIFAETRITDLVIHED